MLLPTAPRAQDGHPPVREPQPGVVAATRSPIGAGGHGDASHGRGFDIVDWNFSANDSIRLALLGLEAICLAGGVAVLWIVVLHRTVKARTRELRAARDGLERLVAGRTRELRDRNFILDAVVEGSADAIFVKDRDGRYLLVNRQAAAYLDADPADLLGKTNADIFPPTVAAETTARDRAVIETGETSDVEEILYFQGRERIAHAYKVPYRDGGGNVIGVIGIVRDITERKRAEEALHESEARQRLLLSGIAVGFGVEDLEGRSISPNEGLARMLGYTLDEFRAMRFTDYTQPEYVERDVALFREMAAGRRDGYQMEKRYITKDGRVAWGRLTRTVVRDGNGRPQYCLGMVEDITERKQAEEALRASEERFAKAFRASPAPMSISLIASGLTLEVNDEWVAMLGFSRDEAIGRTSAEMGCWTGATQRSAIIERLTRKGSFRGFEATVMTKGGQARRVILAGETIDQERMLLVFHDITERLDMERRLAHAQKMEAVGQLTGGIAHEFNNLLQAVQANIELVRQHAAGDARVGGFLDQMLASSRDGAKLTGQLLSFSRQQLLQPMAVDANQLVRGLLPSLAQTLGEDIEIEPVLAADLPVILADPRSLKSALLNIAGNARAAMPDGGRLTVTTRDKWVEDGVILEDGVLPAGRYVEISIADTGCGMPKEVLEHAIEPFYTTKGIGESTGLGLSMAYGFARQSGGLMTLESEIGKGTTVHVLLPVAPSSACRQSS